MTGGGQAGGAAGGGQRGGTGDRVRVSILETRGSTPREVGAEMIVTTSATTGSIGGGAVEHAAIARARAMLRDGTAADRLTVPLGPEIGQCCGGTMTLGFDRTAPRPRPPGPAVLVFGAGHVGQALVRALMPLPLSPRLIDSRAEALAAAPPGLATTLTVLPEAEIRRAPPGSAFVVMTHDHALDFLLTAEALARGDAAYVGLIGSRTKRAAFARRARAQGLGLDGLTCPIAAGFIRDKRPEVIAAFAAAEILTHVLAPAAPA